MPVILGVLSDTHGSDARAARAVALLRRIGVDALLHCGDVGSEGVLDALTGLPAWFVWGNTDHDSADLARYARAIGLTPPGDVPLRIELAGRRLALLHGHESIAGRIYNRLLEGDVEGFERLADCDYLLHGHTHMAIDRRFGSVRIINPGALQRARTYTVATLDLAQDRVEHWVVEDQDSGRFPARFRLIEE